MKSYSFLFCIFLSIALGCKDSSKGVLTVITPQEMQNLLRIDDVQIIDVRTLEEYKTGFIPESQNIDYFSSTFSQDILTLDKTKPVLVYCKSGGRSAKCAKKLIDAGFIKIYDLEGGVSKWKHQGFKLETKL